MISQHGKHFSHSCRKLPTTLFRRRTVVCLSHSPSPPLSCLFATSTSRFSVVLAAVTERTERTNDNVLPDGRLLGFFFLSFFSTLFLHYQVSTGKWHACALPPSATPISSHHPHPTLPLKLTLLPTSPPQPLPHPHPPPHLRTIMRICAHGCWWR